MSDTKREFDYVVVGGGSAGCVLAARLTEDPTVTVCLLEAGPADKSVLIHCPAGFALQARLGGLNWGLESVPQTGLGGRRSYQPRGKVLGGSSSVNAMIYLRGQPQDYDAWAAEGNSGWSFQDVLPYFKRAEHNERGADAWHGVGGPLNVMDMSSPNPFSHLFVRAAEQAGFDANPDFNGASQEGAGLFQVTQKAGERCSAAKAYVTPNLARPNLVVRTDARTLRIVFEDRRAIGVEVEIGGVRSILRAGREVLLSAGAIHSPQLLMLSGVGDEAVLRASGIPLLHALPGVGRNLQDHLDVTLVMDGPKLRDLLGVSLAGALAILRGVFEWRRYRRGLLTTIIGEGGAFLKSSPSEERPDLQLHFVIGKLVDHGRQILFGHGFSCHVCLLRPKSRGTVTLDKADPGGAPLIDPQFLAERDDLERLVRGVRIVRHILEQPALAAHGARELQASAKARSDAEIEAFIRGHADTIYHPVGTCRMGGGPMDVVDAELRVHGVQGLRVVDASIMPSIVSGNTNAPTVMIAEKAADMIKAAAAQAGAESLTPALSREREREKAPT